MSEEKDNKGGAGEGAGGDGFKPIASQADLDRIITDRLNRERSKFADYDDLKTKAAEYDKGQEASKTELQKEREAREAAEKERDGLKVSHLKLDVGVAKGLTPAQAHRLVGSTKEELEADADSLLADFKPADGGKRPPPKKLQSGSAGSGEQTTGKERAAAALRQLRGAN